MYDASGGAFALLKTGERSPDADEETEGVAGGIGQHVQRLTVVIGAVE